MLRSILSILLITLSICSFAQKQDKEDKQRAREEMLEYRRAYEEKQKMIDEAEYSFGHNDTSKRYFFKTFDDLVNGIPVSNEKYGGKRRMILGIESVSVLENGKFTRKKIKELGYWGCIDEFGQIIRFYDNHSYYVLSLGKISSYIKALDAQIKTDEEGSISLAWTVDQTGGYVDYISQGPNGELEKFSEKKLSNYTSNYPEVMEKYKAEKIDKSVSNWRGKITFKIAKYADMYNEHY